jgi:hypothetical protein
MPLRIVFVRAELGVVIEVPARELARRDAARDRVEQAEQPLERRMPALEDGVVHDLVQQHREVELRCSSRSASTGISRARSRFSCCACSA